MVAPRVEIDDYMVFTHQLVGPTHVAVMRFFFRASIAMGAAIDYQQLVSAWDDVLRPVLVAMYPNSVGYRDPSVQRILPIPATIQYYSAGGFAPGTRTSTVMPQQVCGMITKVTGIAGRSFRGRLYVPFPSEEDNDGLTPHPNNGYLTTLGTLSAVALDVRGFTIGGGSLQLDPQLYQPTLDNFVDIVDTTERGYWTTQKRRQRNAIQLGG